eukprot:3872362-Pyramimonas_sp.AAC.1
MSSNSLNILPVKGAIDYVPRQPLKPPERPQAAPPVRHSEIVVDAACQIIVVVHIEQALRALQETLQALHVGALVGARVMALPIVAVLHLV